MSKVINKIKKLLKIDYLEGQTTFNESNVEDLGGVSENVISNTKKTTNKK